MEFVKLVGPAGMFFIMFSLALSLKTQAFKEIAKNPSKFLFRSCSTINWNAINWIYNCFDHTISNGGKVGIVLITCLPSAVTSNYLSKKMGGNVALSISLTAITSLIAFVTIPIIIKIYFVVIKMTLV